MKIQIPILGWGEKISGGMSLLLEVCAPLYVGDFELCAL